MRMKIWLDNKRPAPQGYQWCRNAEEFKDLLKHQLGWHQVEFIDIGNKFYNSLEMSEILNYLHEYLLDFPIHIHSTYTNGRLLDAAIKQRVYDLFDENTYGKLDEDADHPIHLISKYLNGENNDL